MGEGSDAFVSSPGLPSSSSLLLSLCLHAAAVAGAAMIHTALPPLEKPAEKVSPSTEILIGDHLYYVTQLPDSLPPARSSGITAPKPKLKPKADQGSKPAPEQIAAIAPPETPPEVEERPTPRPAPRVPRVFVPPVVHKDISTPQTLIQPDSAPELTPQDARLPSFRVWTANLPK